MKDIKYIAIENNDGDLLVFVDDINVINKEGYNVIIGYGEPEFEDYYGEPRLVHNDPVEVFEVYVEIEAADVDPHDLMNGVNDYLNRHDFGVW